MALEILHKKSAVSQKLPLPSDLKPGEIALNYHADGPFLTCKDTAGNIRKLNHIWVSASAPSSPTVGDAWYDISTDPGILYLYKDDVNGWQQLTQTVTTATTAAFGTVRLADADAVTNGTSGRVVDAAQLQSAISGYSITLNGTAPISIGGNSSQPNVSISPGSARQVLQTSASGAGVEFTNNIDLPGTLDVRGKATLHNLTTFNYDSIVIQNSKTPATASSTGIAGQTAWDANYIYVCVATNTWKRTALSSW